jgi:hypothetical protein
MRIRTAIVLATLHMHVLAQTAAPVVPSDWADQGAPRAAPREQAIKDAVREILAEEGKPASSERADVFGSDRRERFERGFEEARVPGCLRPDGLKHQPARIGPIGLSYLLALPFLVAAKVRGKCH